MRAKNQYRWAISLFAIFSITFASQVAKADDPDWSLTADLTFASKYVTDGFRVGEGDPVLQPGLIVRTPARALSLVFWSALQWDRSQQKWDEFDFLTRYNRTFYEGAKLAFNLHGYYLKWFNPKLEPSSGRKKGQSGNKVHAGISFPTLVSFAGSFIVPTYNLYYWLATDQESPGGTRHEALFQYDRWLPTWILQSYQPYFGTSLSLSYNDGAFGVTPGWSHSTVQLRAGAQVFGNQLALTLNRQWSYQPSVNPQNEFWTTASITREF